MMENDTVLFLSTFEAPHAVQLFIFSLCLLVYIFIVISNMLVLVTVVTCTDLHKPMHIFLCSLVVMDVIGINTYMPKQLHMLLTGDRQILRLFCTIQMFWIYFCTLGEIFTLAIMAYDRYLAVCYPLHYHAIVTAKRAIVALLLNCLFTVMLAGSQTALIIPLKLKDTERQIDGVLCDNMGIIKLAASDTRINELYGTAVIGVELVALCIIVYTYVRIIVECKRSQSNQFRKKTIETLVTHFSVLSVFFVALFVTLLVPRFMKAGQGSSLSNIKCASQFSIFVVPIANVTIYFFRTKSLKVAIIARCYKFFAVFHVRFHKVHDVGDTGARY